MVLTTTTFSPNPSPRIDTPEGVAAHLDSLMALVPELLPMRTRVGDVLPRVNPKGFAGMAKVICGQQLSVQSAILSSILLLES